MPLACELRIKFYAQEIVLFRQDLLYRMRRSSLIPPSSEKTNDPFEHVRQVYCFRSKYYFLNCIACVMTVMAWYFFAACCYYYSSKPSMPSPPHSTAHYLEL